MLEVIKPSYEILTPIGPHLVKHLERCGRVCYKSEERITDGSADKFVRMICRNQHESVLEHASVSVIIVCSRAASHQLVRHRLGAYSQESQRYCNYGKSNLLRVIAPTSLYIAEGVYLPEDLNHLHLSVQAVRWLAQVMSSYREYLVALDSMPPEDARYVLPNATKTELAVTYNLRQWRHVFKERALNKHAQWEIRSVMTGLLDEFKKEMPSVFGDLI